MGSLLTLESVARVLGDRIAEANGRRRARTLTPQDCFEVANEALQSPWGIAFRSGGEVDDSRARTTGCLAVRVPDGVVVGVTEHGARQVTPARGWPELAPWSTWAMPPNVPRCEAWANRPRLDRARFEVPAKVASDDGEALLARVLEAPDDVGARLVYADWLSERGEPRGELIALQCQLSALAPEAPERAELEARERALRAEHEEAWLAELGLSVVSVRWENGFLDEVTVLAASVEQLPQALFSREPVRALRVVDATADHAAVLAALPMLERVKGLRFTNSNGQAGRALGGEGLDVLLESRHLHTLERFELEGQHLDDIGAMVLARKAGPVAPKLRSLRISGDEVGAVGAEVLARMKWVRDLERFSLTRCVIRGEDGALGIVEPGVLHWKVLELDGNPLGDGGAKAIAESASLPDLELLSVQHCGLKQAGLRALIDSPLLAKAKLLLQHNRMDPLTEAKWMRR